MKKQKQAEIDIAKIEKELAEKKEAKTKKDNDVAAEEDLDAYMNKLTKKPGNDKSLFVLQKELNQLKKVHLVRIMSIHLSFIHIVLQDNDRLIKLVKLTKPSDIL